MPHWGPAALPAAPDNATVDINTVCLYSINVGAGASQRSTTPRTPQHMTLDEIVGNFRLYAVCAPCRRMVELPVQPLCQRLGSQTPVADVRGRVRCKQCHARTNDIRIIYVGPGGAVSGFHYRR